MTVLGDIVFYLFEFRIVELLPRQLIRQPVQQLVYLMRAISANNDVERDVI